MQLTMTKDPLDLDIDLDVGPAPAVRTYAHQVSLPCYGRGKRLCDLRVPEIPRCLLASSATRNLTTESESSSKPGRGRGRSRRSARNDDECRSLSPGGLQGAIHTSVECRSVCSENSNRDSLSHLQEDKSQSFQHCNYVDSDVEKTQHESHTLHRPRSASNEIPTDTYHTPAKHSATMSQHLEEDVVWDSPPLKLQNGWSIHPPKVVQFEGIPADYDLNIICELLSLYAPIIDWEHKTCDGDLSLRMKFSDAEVCDSIEMNMDKSDFTGTGSHIRCKHLRD